MGVSITPEFSLPHTHINSTVPEYSTIYLSLTYAHSARIVKYLWAHLFEVFVIVAMHNVNLTKNFCQEKVVDPPTRNLNNETYVTKQGS